MYKLSTIEWMILTQLENLLQGFLEAMQIVSQAGTPLLHHVIPLIDLCMTLLEDAIADSSNHQSVHVAAVCGLRVLNKYYSKTDDSVMYRIAMVLHPRYKLEYFCCQRWEASWIETAEEIAKKRKHYHEDIDSFGLNVDADVDALTAYLEALIVEVHLDPIQYWSLQLSGGNPLVQMALDFLSAPAASTDVERAFSCGGLTVSKRRHALSDQSVHCGTVFGLWAGVPGLIQENNIVSSMKERNKRTKVTKVPNVYIDLESDIE
ncbi:hypothetical protein QCA50_011608 [Cerrena zonata]|uniref:HAT C-terminal dimerisation domain-containing protein n=1 Tax=Cerrena zonata TaxID=2478898 RepID=A0AAW0FVL2_9APHY